MDNSNNGWSEWKKLSPVSKEGRYFQEILKVCGGSITETPKQYQTDGSGLFRFRISSVAAQISGISAPGTIFEGKFDLDGHLVPGTAQQIS